MNPMEKASVHNFGLIADPLALGAEIPSFAKWRHTLQVFCPTEGTAHGTPHMRGVRGDDPEKGSPGKLSIVERGRQRPRTTRSTPELG
jgi:hypothetical protein